MSNVRVAQEATDAETFIEVVNQTLARLFDQDPRGGVKIVRVDNWFGPKWLEFSGKMLGALGTWRAKLTVPPFVPNRIRFEHHYRRNDDGAYSQVEVAKLHGARSSGDNLNVRVVDIAPEAAILWFSSNTGVTQRGCIMAYIPSGDGYWSWYVGFDGARGWKRVLLKGISERELADFAGMTLPNK